MIYEAEANIAREGLKNSWNQCRNAERNCGGNGSCNLRANEFFRENTSSYIKIISISKILH